MDQRKIVMLAGKGVSTNILYHALKNEFKIEAIILENGVNRVEFLKKRIKKVGIVKVAGQVLFQLSVAELLKLFSEKRKRQILSQFNLHDAPIPEDKAIEVMSVNDESTIAILQKLQPTVVIVNGTRIISKEVLNCVEAKFLNIHAGITPNYRNVHGAYWAIVNNDYDNCGVTVHLVDPGIDTGNIIYQKKIVVTPKDNFTTYPLIQLAEGINFMKKALRDIFEDKLITKKRKGNGNLWHHPTLTQYMFHRLVYNKK